MTAPPGAVAACMQHAITTLQELTSAQLEDLAQGRGRLEYRAYADAPPLPTRHVHAPERPRRPRPAADRSAEPSTEVLMAVEAIRALGTPAEVAAYLDANDRAFSAPVLKQIARALGPTVSTAARTKTDLKRNIVEGTAGFRARSASMSGGAWAR